MTTGFYFLSPEARIILLTTELGETEGYCHVDGYGSRLCPADQNKCLWTDKYSVDPDDTGRF